MTDPQQVPTCVCQVVFAVVPLQPKVCVDACYSKHRRKDELPLAEDLVDWVRNYLAERVSNVDERLWPGKWYRKAGEILQADLAAARKAWLSETSDPDEQEKREQSDYLKSEDAVGHVVDFHSLRHGFITYLVTANCPPKVAQTLARHSTISLTMDRYTHLGTADLVAGLKRLPVVGGEWDGGESLRQLPQVEEKLKRILAGIPQVAKDSGKLGMNPTLRPARLQDTANARGFAS